tara:strand:+ start:1826 stop:2020 length:195 start_codon:yes stop_codon:yes gene_type:complete
MGLISKVKNNAKINEKPEFSFIQLSQEELSIILELIKNSNFGGNMIDALYHLTAKLQKEYHKGE